MKWLTADADHRNVQADWMRLRGRKFNIAGFKVGASLLDERVNWKRVPSNQFASADQMRAAGWSMDYRRDSDGRLAV